MSVLKQSMNSFELIIIDDGSKDNSKKIIDKFKKNKKSSVFQKNKGLTVSNNLALRLAKGKYIMRLDADDNLIEMLFK